jgi:hypothetical protein
MQTKGNIIFSISYLYIFGQQTGRQKFLLEKNFDLLVMFPNIGSVPPFQIIIIHLYIDVVILHCMLVSRHDCVLGSLIM